MGTTSDSEAFSNALRLRRKVRIDGKDWPYSGPWDTGDREFGGVRDDDCVTGKTLDSVTVPVRDPNAVVQLPGVLAFHGCPVDHVSFLLTRVEPLKTDGVSAALPAVLQPMAWEIWAGAGARVSMVCSGSNVPGKDYTQAMGVLASVRGLLAEWWELRAVMDSSVGATHNFKMYVRVLADRLGGIGGSGPGAKCAVSCDPDVSVIGVVAI